ncbi:hypothetical protein [Streptomyces minutiscleroticus]|uniref:hypothetical protein n=1 Tax=Streptomyces minutiscleroticus TaxID=68238 RepID=UPI00332673AC
MTSDLRTASSTAGEQLRTALVDQLQAGGHVRTLAVETAPHTALRHPFVPDASLADAYADAPVSIECDIDGTPISCTAQPGPS